MKKIDVIPTKDSAKKLVHPSHGILGEGATWNHDTFTSRRLSDGSITRAVPKSTDDEKPAEDKPIEAQARAATIRVADPK